MVHIGSVEGGEDEHKKQQVEATLNSTSNSDIGYDENASNKQYYFDANNNLAEKRSSWILPKSTLATASPPLMSSYAEATTDEQIPYNILPRYDESSNGWTANKTDKSVYEISYL